MINICKSLGKILGLVFAIALFAGCGSRIQITTADEVKQALEKHTPVNEYGYYVLKDKKIQQVEELTEMTLLVCGNTPANADVLVAASAINSLGKPLFRASKLYFINPNIDCQGFGPCARMNQTVSFKGISNKFSQQGYIYKSRTSSDALLLNCINAMHDDLDLVLLIERDELSHQKGAVTEIVFK